MYMANRVLQAFHVPLGSMLTNNYFSHIHDDQSKSARFNVIWPFQSRDLKQLKRWYVWTEWNREKKKEREKREKEEGEKNDEEEKEGEKEREREKER